MLLTFLRLIGLTLFLGIVLFTDFKSRKIPNLFTMGFALAGIILMIFEKGWPGLILGCGGFLLGLALLFLPYIWGGLGAGDVKMMGTLGVYLIPYGVMAVIWSCLLALICGGLLSLGVAFQKGRLKGSFKNAFGELLGLFAMGLRHKAGPVMHGDIFIPYSLALALGTALYLGYQLVFKG